MNSLQAGKLRIDYNDGFQGDVTLRRADEPTETAPSLTIPAQDFVDIIQAAMFDNFNFGPSIRAAVAEQLPLRRVEK